MILIESKSPATKNENDLDASISVESSKNSHEMTSLEILNKCHLVIFPKKNPICDDENLMKVFIDTVPILSGEYICFIGPSGKLNNEILVLTNYRLFLLMNDHYNPNYLISNEFKSFINVPIMIIESIEIKEIVYLYVYLKNAKTIRLNFSSNERTFLWSQRINSLVNRSYKLEDLFSFRFYSWLTNESKNDDIPNSTTLSIPACIFSKTETGSNLIIKEYKRMKFDPKFWRISEVNKKFELCPSYPETLIVPKSISDDQLLKIASFRSSQRFPTVTWRSKKNGSVIARSSQPNVGLLAWRLNEDELLLKAISDSCETNSSALLIIDARFRSVALANRVKGGGYEYTEYYTNCEIQFMNLENIHVIRSSFQSLRILCQSINDNKLFLSQLENTKWLHHLSGIIKASITVTSAIDQSGKPVLIHCSDGWDRTPQILALSKLLLDPYYRTISGFRVLIEVDWLQFGHKFSQRNGHSSNSNDSSERCPVFLQWLDCVYQILRQYPSAFQFNETFLIKLCYHSYSCLFGTFLCDSNIERDIEHTDERTFSVWSYLNEKNTEIVNQLYDEDFDEVLYPLCEICHMQLWHRLFCEPNITYLAKQDRQSDINLDSEIIKLSPDSSISSSVESSKVNNLLLKNAINDTQTNLLIKKIQSCDNLLNIKNKSVLKKRASVPNIAYHSLKTPTAMQNSTETLVDDLKQNLIEKEVKIKVEYSSSSETEESSFTNSTSTSSIISPLSLKINQLNSVSTSTSGLSDYIHSSSKLPKIKSYFTINYDYIFEKKEDILNSKTRISSNSIPIANPVRNTWSERKKCVKDLIDIDGLTRIEDNSYRKIIEREEKHKKEMRILRDQVNKFKSFFNKLASKSTDMTLDLQFSGEFDDSIKYEDKYDTKSLKGYSSQNDSVCSSWDEIDESDYKYITWVPDYFVTHCQNCNIKFSYRLRKHHCRNCGQVFCYKCADYYSALPNNNLHEPVRVCLNCKMNIDKQKYSSTQSTSGKLSIITRCNQIEKTKYKNNDGKSQKVFVNF